jgi:hypothetical protein
MLRSRFDSFSRWKKYRSLLNSTVEVVLDVGASDGNWWFRHKGLFSHDVLLISIEPQDYRRTPEGIEEKCVVGSTCGDSKIYVGQNRYAASTIEDPGAEEVKAIERHTISCILRKHRVIPGTKIFIKTDVQGLDVEALLSAEEYLVGLVAAQCELQVYPFSNSMSSFSSSVLFLKSAGLEVIEVFDMLERPSDGRLGQLDVALAPEDSSLFKNPRWA